MAFGVEQNLDNDITSDGMTVNKEGAFGPCILWEVEIQTGDLVNKGYDVLLYFMFKLKTNLLWNFFLAYTTDIFLPHEVFKNISFKHYFTLIVSITVSIM